MRFWNFIREETGERTLRLDGAISTETWLDDGITPQEFRAELNSGEGDITVWVNSPGGDCFAATAIYNMLKEYSGRVTVKIELAASAASVIAMAGDSVEISPSGQIFLHDPEMATFGNANEFSTAIKFLGEIKAGIVTAYELKTKLPREEIAQMMTDATWLNARKAVELGFADKIMFSDSGREDISAQMFSERQVTNSLARAFRAKQETADNRVDVASLRRRLNLRRINYE